MNKYVDIISDAILSLGEPNIYDYLQIITSFISVIISTIAVIIAVKIPRKIAEKQDKIALFDKRFASYEVFLTFEAFAYQIDKLSDIKNYKKQFMIIFYNNLDAEFNGIDALTILKSLSLKLQQLVFLFDNITNSEVSKMLESVCDFVIAIEKNKNVEECKNIFVNHVKVFREKHHETILSALKEN